MKCYTASFNVGNVEIWSSDLFFHKKDVLIDIEESLDEIAEEISEFSFLSENEIIEILKRALKSIKRTSIYQDKENNFDFFILEQYVWKNIQDREIFTENIKIENGAK
ncbi:MAG: hypothetical protein LBE82_03930 [Chitinophagaceae bacterium]|jgi:hypothetical protein|nr:hypothetical protein [Chitinophagaceae bacterium]